MNQPDLSLKLDLDLQHLCAELARLDVRLQRAVMCWQAAGQDPGDAFRGLYVSDVEAETLLARPFGTNWGQTMTLDPTAEEMFVEAEAQAQSRVEQLCEVARSQGVTSRLNDLTRAFSLDPFDLDTLLICLAPSLDLRYEKIFGYLQDDITKKRPAVNLVLDLLCPAGPERLLALAHFRDDAPLFRHHLLERATEHGQGKAPLLSQSLMLDETILHWLLGTYQPHGKLAPHLTLTSPRLDPANETLAGEALTVLEQVDIEEYQFVFFGPDQLSQEAAARWVASRLGKPLLTLDLTGVLENEISTYRAIRRALRDSLLTGAVPFLQDWDACLTDGISPPGLLSEICAFPGTVIIAGHAAWQPQGVERSRPLLRIEFRIPEYHRRMALWKYFLNGADLHAEVTIPTLAGQFALTAGQIRDAVALGQDNHTENGNSFTTDELLSAARASSNPRLSTLARKIMPRYGWEDIILPEDQIAQLREIVATVRGRPQVLDDWGVGKKLASSRGVTALFAGPPGTGKTMAAEIIAGELGLDLYKIDLSTVVSKYIGETEKNLELIFKEASSSNAILFFDEADALFGKRSEVRDSHDRYANIEISYLLQRMEAYDGVTVLATNLRANLDEAFTRRLQFAVDFPFPDEADRLRIWRTLFPPEVPREISLDFETLAGRFKLAGGNIRNVLVSAAYEAAADGGKVTMEHLLHGTRRELQKMGRLVNEIDLSRSVEKRTSSR